MLSLNFPLNSVQQVSGDDEFDNPTDVIVDKNGKKIYVVDSDNHRISVFEDDGDDDFHIWDFL